ncbi:uncharacterized protein LOC115758535 isoform X1 [Drosophila novamexicana]|uniref:uncharacterized protein LOC115758535 isoform X1 n=1 Tax=Drosophila novamexicana TaxID=47314 RepID=UPI0011E5FC0E|nr:uncharacterized protein LOC115758535 isoform X1 [Drosophila novamexicana]
MLELVRDDWTLLRDLYRNDRTSLTGYDLINNYIYWPDQAENVKIYTTNENWLKHGSFVLIHSSNDKADVFFNTLNGSLLELQALLSSLKLNSRHWFCGYRHLLRSIVDKYCAERRLKLKKLEHLETFVYYLPQSAIQPFDCRLIADISFGPLDIKHASQVDEHWPHRSSDSLALISDRIRNNVSVGAFDRDGQLLAWCLRSLQGGLSNLYVLPPHRRLGLASLLVRFMAQEIAATGAEVLATIAFGNRISQIFFEKLGFKLIDNIYFTTVPAY